MKILHTADWHLGHRLHEHSQLEEQTLFLAWIENYISNEKIDLLLISGDIFDTSSPSNQSLTMYYNFLVKLQKTSCKNIIITGGNHDSPGTLNAPKELLNALSIKVVGKATEKIADEVFEININDEKVLIGAVPYLRDGDIRRAVAGESFDDLTDKYKKALINHYQEIAIESEKINSSNAPVIAMGHLFATGGSVSDSEQNIYVGTLGHIGAQDFPTYFDYVALGHLHRPQIVGENDKIRYSGSPNILSFSELNYDKKIIVLEISANKISNIEDVIVPNFREFYKLKGSMEACIAKFPSIISNSYQLKPWVEIVLDQDNTIQTDELKIASESYDFEILKITLKNQRKIKGIEELLADATSIKELVPTEVFKLKCEEMDFDLDQNQQVWDAFNEVLQAVKNQ
ncbi:exonuclease SbcCD subunit D C-terminal domain-containing protein [Tenacibaculum finnmarkense]|uniref:exonuclease SbcCD subunit D C-terminal domain-containing protein n=1 Tax=Tenacibaculum finnmarkense TaxID=2781243 RepID=UPI001E2DC476|nr:exonuclease SbcCD subunit D C-terminal domain-containing protein [Tenacibaculum finnmarkense]MCD8411231.1 exonuclease SbcCD subunit D C-terminal domain-containing protein [Tenacibaculum finnmarkense genomovar ulcerans]MCG8206685.1 exonuclease SbcCD subunit D C-terminal domain-containing protein [Tenacibaculum finnmarkense genomovar finnmarkense]MCG8722811.1 exonuclease subunit SbcD [Tenacibaculum finnmarkense]MCG8741196.1 exonuclease subunit SbcD [Tenacibaculum finnmarkense]MCG8764479.1 exo